MLDSMKDVFLGPWATHQQSKRDCGVSWSNGGEIILLSFCFLHTFVGSQTSAGSKLMILTWWCAFFGIHMSGIQFPILLTAEDRNVVLGVKVVAWKMFFWNSVHFAEVTPLMP